MVSGNDFSLKRPANTKSPTNANKLARSTLKAISSYGLVGYFWFNFRRNRVLMEELASKGHNLTIVSVDVDEKPRFPNMRAPNGCNAY